MFAIEKRLGTHSSKQAKHTLPSLAETGIQNLKCQSKTKKSIINID